MQPHAILGAAFRAGLLKFIDRAQFVGVSLSTNGRFSKTVQAQGLKLKSAVSLLRGKVDQYEVNPNGLNKQLRDEAKQAIDTLLRATLLAVNAEANGDLDRLVSSGFELNSAKHTTQEAAAAPEFIDLFVYPKETGVVEFKIDKVDKMSDYLVKYRVARAGEPEGEWHSVLSTTAGRVTHLESIVQYEFRAAAINAYSKKHNEYNYSIISKCVVQ